MSDHAFLAPWLLALALVIPLGWIAQRRRGEPAVAFAPAPLTADLPRTWRVRLAPLPRILQGAGIEHAVVNAGQSSIAAIGHPPDREGWMVDLGVDGAGLGEIELRDASISTSRQGRIPLRSGDRGYGD